MGNILTKCVLQQGYHVFRRVMIILDVEVVSPGSEVGCRIGNPVSWTPDGQAPPAPTAAAAPAAAAPSRPVNGHGSSSRSTAPTPAAQPTRSSPLKPPAAVNGGNGGGMIFIALLF